jgi:hypothetical protein
MCFIYSENDKIPILSISLCICPTKKHYKISIYQQEGVGLNNTNNFLNDVHVNVCVAYNLGKKTTLTTTIPFFNSIILLKNLCMKQCTCWIFKERKEKSGTCSSNLLLLSHVTLYTYNYSLYISRSFFDTHVYE